jgi:hypothetical protein
MGSRPCRALHRLCTRRRFKFSHVNWLVGLQAEGHLARCGHVADAAVGHDQHRHQHGKHNGARCDLGRAMGRAGARLGSAARAPAHPAVPSRIDAIEFGQATRLLDAGCGSGVAAALAELRRGRQPRRLGADQYLGQPRDCEMRAVFAAYGRCCHPTPGRRRPVRAVRAGPAGGAGSTGRAHPIHAAEVACPFDYPDGQAAWRTPLTCGGPDWLRRRPAVRLTESGP